MSKETHRGMWGALRPAIRRTSAEELLHARRTETKTSEPAPHTGAFGRIAADVPTVAEELLHARRTETKTSEPAPHTGAFGRIAADVPTVAEEPDLPTGNVPVVPARSKLREQGVGTRVRTRTNVSTGFVPLVRDSKSTPKNPTLSDLNRETMQKAAEAEAAAAAEAEKAAEAEAVATAAAKPPAPVTPTRSQTPMRRCPPWQPRPKRQNAPQPAKTPWKTPRASSSSAQRSSRSPYR